jgi:type VI secretion system protein ImpL
METSLFDKVAVKAVNTFATLIKNWTIEWTILSIFVGILIIFLLKEKPVTGSVRLIKNILWKLIKWISKKISGVLGKSSINIKVFQKSGKYLDTFFSNVKAMSTKSGKSYYETPTYLALSVGSDIESLMKGVETNTSKGRFPKSEYNKDWFIFDHGTVLNFPQPNIIYDELMYYRPERPLDGVIISLSVKKLLTLPNTEIEQEAKKLFTNLWQLQKKFQFVLPVYLIITDCNYLDGFSDYWQLEEMQKHRHDILGWSNPHEKNKQFEEQWIDDGITDVNTSLRQLHINFMQSTKSHPSIDLLLFPNRLASLSSQIKTFCETLFNSTNYHESFMFRGFYFSGNLQDDGQSTKDHQNSSSILVQQLFNKRIFLEANLAYSPQQKIFSSNRKLKTFQYMFSAMFLGLSTWLTLDTIELSYQSNNLANKIELPTPPANNSTTRNIKYVHNVLEHVSSMDASNLFYWSNPASWFSSFEQDLMDYFSDNIFSDIVFPAFNCRANQLLVQQKNTPVEQGEYIKWITQLSDYFLLEKRLHQLMKSEDYSISKVESEFNNLVNHLYDTKLPSSFYEKSSIYFNAISNISYETELRYFGDDLSKAEKPTVYCNLPPISHDDVWSKVKVNTAQYLTNVSYQIQAPKAFFSQITELQSLPTDKNESKHKGNFASELNSYLIWARNIQQHWIRDSEGGNICSKIKQPFNNLADIINPLEKDLSNEFKDKCNTTVEAQFKLDSPLLNGGLYTFYDDKITFSTKAQSLYTSMESLSALSFINVEPALNNEEQLTEFYWSVDHLNTALKMFEEYENFAKINYQSVSLPKLDSENSNRYLAQAVTLNQLQQAMISTILKSRTQSPDGYYSSQYRPINKQESQIQSYVTNQQQASVVLLKLNDIFQTLDFTSSSQKLLRIAQNNALSLLKKIDALYSDNRLYQPLPRFHWGAHLYTESMYGVYSEGQLEDYLQAQSGRASYIAVNYAEPIVTFLNETRAKYPTSDYTIISKWQNTLVELHKQEQNKDNNTSLLALESFFNNHLLLTNQSNCFENGKNFILPNQNNIFAISHRTIINEAKSLCQSYTAEKIQQEYANVQRDFTQMLAKKYPFSSAHSAQSISPASIKKFIEKYSGKTSGLAQRMDILVWAKRHDKDKAKYQKKLNFIRQLDTSIEFFNALIGASSAPDAQGLEIAVEFNVLQNQAKNTAHISLWEFTSANSKLRYPSYDEQQPSNIYWLPNTPTKVSLSWAEGSPYKAFANLGKTKADQLIYSEAGVWSLLKFIQKHRSSRPDTDTLQENSILLDFTAKLRNRTTKVNKSKQSALALMRLNLYGFDPDTKQYISIKFPKSFPHYAPESSIAKNKPDNIGEHYAINR